MEIKRLRFESVYKNRTILPLIFSGIMIFYLCFSILLMLSYVKIDIFKLPEALYILLLHGLFVFIGISYFRNKLFAWYGMTGLFCYKIYLNLFLVLGLVGHLLFGKEIYTMLHTEMPDLKLNWSMIKIFLELLLYSILLKISFNKEILKDFNLGKQSKKQLIVKVFLLSTAGTVIYFGVWFLIFKFYSA